jgi:glycosyltransferase involved in cell wall biosynthesis
MKGKYIIILPCFNEENVINILLESIENELSESGFSFTIIVVDDASTDDTLEVLKNFKFSSDAFELKVIKLNINSGHQEAIRLGLKYTKNYFENYKGVIVMDADGEDEPKAILKLLKINKFDIVFVARTKRQEGMVFITSYMMYKIMFKLLTGRSISYGNYSMISPVVLNSIHTQKFFHYSAFLSKQKFDIKKIYSARNKRIDGKSKMNYNGLVLHGLKSMIEFSEEALVLFLKIFVFALLSLFAFGGFILYSKFVSHKAIGGWSSMIGISLVNACLIIFGTIIISLLLLSVKNTLKQSDNDYEIIR